jgi:hypothetical protein
MGVHPSTDLKDCDEFTRLNSKCRSAGNRLYFFMRTNITSWLSVIKTANNKFWKQFNQRKTRTLRYSTVVVIFTLIFWQLEVIAWATLSRTEELSGRHSTPFKKNPGSVSVKFIMLLMSLSEPDNSLRKSKLLYWSNILVSWDSVRMLTTWLYTYLSNRDDKVSCGGRRTRSSKSSRSTVRTRVVD